MTTLARFGSQVCNSPPIYRAMIICSMALQYLQAIAPSSVDFSLDEALARIRALSEALQEACHERDGLLAKVERHAS